MKNTLPFATKTRVISFILTLLLIFYTVPAAVFAEVLTDSAEKEQEVTDSAENKVLEEPEKHKEVFEVTELREENTKHFRLEDGTYLAASYVAPVHYKDEEGKWQDIDNRLFLLGSEFSTTDAKIKFSKKITGNENLFTLRDGNTKITMSLIGANKKTEGKVTTDYLSDDLEETKLGKLMNLEKLMSKVLYEDILDGVDVEYVVHSRNIKENIIVKERAESYSYSFELKLNGLQAALDDEGNVILCDDGENAKYRIPAPIVYDAVGQLAPSGSAYYTLSGSGKKFVLTVTVDSEWMNNEDILFPVTVDPAIEDAASVAYVEDRSVGWNSGDPYIVIESSSGPTYFKLNTLPELSNTTLINEAKVNLKYLRSSGKVFPSIALYGVRFVPSSGQTEGAIIENGIIDYEVGSNPKWTYTFDVTSLVQSWYQSPNESHGFAITRYVAAGEDPLVTGGGSVGVMHLYSTETIGTYSTSPFFEISYTSMLGIEDYWSYASQSAGIAGSGHVNLASGTLSFVVDTMSSTDYLMPVTPTLVYNSALANRQYNFQNAYTAYENSYTPYGFKLNLNESIILKDVVLSDGTTGTHYVYADSDGTLHTFNSTALTDEDGLGLEMEISSDELIIITDKNKTKKYFVAISGDYGSGWYLAQIEDKVGNKVLITADSAERPMLISLIPKGHTEAINMLQISYNSAGVISSIQSAVTGNQQSVQFLYSNTYNGSISNSASKYLRQVVYKNGAESVTASYEYDSNGLLVKAKDNLSSEYITYIYFSKRVDSVTEYGKSNEQGQKIELSYETGFTVLRSSGSDDSLGTADDILTNYVYDSHGRVINYYSTDASGTTLYGATYGKYDDKENSKNNIKESNTLNGSSVNYLLNGDFENWTSSSGAPTYWTKSQNVSRHNNAFNSHNLYSAKILFNSESEAYISQTVSLKAGTYTLSVSLPEFTLAGNYDIQYVDDNEFVIREVKG